MALLKKKLSVEDLNEMPPAEVDSFFNLEPSLVVSHESDEAYGDGDTGADALYTSYQDLLLIYEDLIGRNISRFVDLGAGNCRSKILFDYLAAPFTSTAIEFAKERVDSAMKAYDYLNIKGDIDEFRIEDLKLSDLAPYGALFIYLPVGPTLDHIINKLKEVSCHKDRILYVIESHGDLIPYLQDHLTSLELLDKKKLNSNRHDPYLWIFKLSSSRKQLAREDELKDKARHSIEHFNGFSLKYLENWEKWFLFSLYRKDWLPQLLVQEDSFQWLASLEDWQYGVVENTIETKYPYRIHQLDQIKAVIWPSDEWRDLVEKRRDIFKPPLNAIRKIITTPKAKIEYAGGQIDECKGLSFRGEYPSLS